MFNYSFQSRKNSPYIGFGIVNMFILSKNEEFTYYWFQYEYNRSIPVYHLGLAAALGYKMQMNNDKALIMEFGFQYTTNLNVNQYLRFTHTILSLNIGFHF